MGAFKTKIIRSRYSLSPFSSEQMLAIGNNLLSSIKKRIRSGTNANDQEARALKPTMKGREIPYADQKAHKGLNPYRDWVYSGRLMRAMQVTRASENRFTIGFTDDRTDKIVHINNRGTKMFGVSPKDRVALVDGIRQVFQTGNVIQFKRVV
jgi:hypothetical protein